MRPQPAGEVPSAFPRSSRGPGVRGKGGPKTPGGKAISRRNALQHGLTANELLPEVLQPGRVEVYEQSLQRDYPPGSTLGRPEHPAAHPDQSRGSCRG